MYKRIAVYILSFLLFIVLAFSVHTYVFTEFAERSPIKLEALYAFHTFFTLALVIVLTYLMFQDKFKDQIGFFYLASMMVKIILFCIVFKAQIFNDRSFSNQEGVNLLIPIGLALFFEILFLSRLLNKNHPTKND